MGKGAVIRLFSADADVLQKGGFAVGTVACLLPIA